MRKHVMAALLATFAVMPAALAADLPSRGGPVSPDPGYSSGAPFAWTGLYAGLNAGYGWGGYNRGARPLIGNGTGGVLGGQVGYNYQFGYFVAGVEGDFNASWINSKASPVTGVATKGSLDWFGTLRGRAGFAADHALIYATGGYAGGEVKSSLVAAAPAAAFSTPGWRNGYALGGGIEYAFTNNISAKAEYLYVNLGSQTLFSGPWATSSTYSASMVRGGINYHF